MARDPHEPPRELTASQAMQDALTGEPTEHAHEPGTMDITTQEKTFAGFMAWSTRTVIVIVAILILLYLVNG